MKFTIARVFLGTTAAALMMVASAPRAGADVLLTAIETAGGDVVISGGGTLDLAGMTGPSTGFDLGALHPVTGQINMGPNSDTDDDLYDGLLTGGPANFGTGGVALASIGLGDVFLISPQVHVIGVPDGYTSGSALSATDTYTGQTFASLGMTPGTCVWTLPGTARRPLGDTFTLQIGPTAVPTPMAASAGLALLAGLGLLKRRRATADVQ